jgi:hypothetical protein
MSIWELYYHAKQVAAGVRYTQNVVNGTRPLSFGAINQWVAKTRLFEFVAANSVPSDVVNPVFRPNDLVDLHLSIVQRQPLPAKDALFFVAACNFEQLSHNEQVSPVGFLPYCPTHQWSHVHLWPNPSARGDQVVPRRQRLGGPA